MNALRRKNGFTLIEIIVVIAIIAMLLAILIPILSKIKVSSRKFICKSNLKQWSLVFGMYFQENGGRIFDDHVHSGFDKHWAGITRQYYDDLEIMLCPNTTKPRHPLGLDGTVKEGVINRSPYASWGYVQFTVPNGKYVNGSYGINIWVTEPNVNLNSPDNPKHWGNRDIKVSSNVPLLGDSLGSLARPRDWHPPPKMDNPMWNYGGDNVGSFNVCTNRHQGKVQYLFMDLSVRSVGLKELWTLDWHRDYDKANPYADPDSPLWDDYEWIQKACR